MKGSIIGLTLYINANVQPAETSFELENGLAKRPTFFFSRSR